MADWVRLRIRDMISSSLPGDWGSSEGNPDNGVPVLRSTNFRNDGSIDYSDVVYRQIALRRLGARRVDKGTILVEKSGGSPSQPAGRVVYCDRDFDGTASNFIEVIKVKDDFSARFVAYLLYHLYTNGLVLKYQQQTTGIINFKWNEYCDESVYCPTSVAEQAKIAELVSTVDKAIKQTEELIAKQQRIKTGLMQDLLTRGIDEHGNIRSEETHQFKDSLFGRIPVEWEETVLGEACDVCNNLRKPIAALVRETMQGDYPYYGPTGILDYIDEYRIDGKYVLIGEDGDHFLKFANQEMTLLVDGRYNVNNHAHVIRGKGDVLTEWLHLFFLHRDITLYLTRQGAGRFKLNKAALLRLPMLVPKDKAEQQRILDVMNYLRRYQAINDNYLDKLRLQKTALMQDLLTGTKHVTPLLTECEVVRS